MDYGCNERRKTKKDLRRKRRERVFKRGGHDRAQPLRVIPSS